jgi:hypothetical protein
MFVTLPSMPLLQIAIISDIARQEVPESGVTVAFDPSISISNFLPAIPSSEVE